MPGAFAKGKVYYAWYIDAGGTRRYRATEHRVSDGEPAHRRAQAVARQMQRDEDRLRDGKGPLTVRRWAEEFLKRRKGRPIFTHYEQILRNYVVDIEIDKKLFGDTPLSQVETLQVREIVARARKAKPLRNTRSRKEELSPSYMRGIAKLLRALFKEAVYFQHIQTSPVIIDARYDLPRMRDADPDWRAGARFDAEEIPGLLTDPRIPFDRRTYYALAVLTGMRPGEIWALTLDRCMVPAKPWPLIRLRDIDTKAGIARDIPILPCLAELLRDWIDQGRLEHLAPSARQTDLVLPAHRGGQRHRGHVNQQLSQDLAVLGLRHRSCYDTRATFISIAEVSGIPRRIVQAITHGCGTATVMDGYSRPTYAELCKGMERFEIPGITDLDAISLATHVQLWQSTPMLAAAIGSSQQSPRSRHLSHPDVRQSSQDLNITSLAHPSLRQETSDYDTGSSTASTPDRLLESLRLASLVSVCAVALRSVNPQEAAAAREDLRAAGLPDDAITALTEGDRNKRRTPWS